MPLLRGCCCCLDLKVGTLVIGALNLIGSLISSVLWGIALVLLTLYFSESDTQHDHHDPDYSHGRFPPDSSDYHDEQGDRGIFELFEMVQRNFETTKIIIVVLLILSVINVVISCLLIHAVRKNNRFLMLPWIVMQIIYQILVIVVVVCVFVLMKITIISGVYGICIGLSFLINLYFILVVISQFQALGIIRMHDGINEMSLK